MSDPTTTDASRYLLALVRAAIAECESRLKVCEAQTPGPWRNVFWHGISLPPDSNGPRLTVACSMGEADLLAICLQRLARPQELRALIATLRKIEKAVPWGLTAFVEDLLDGIVRELGVRA